MRTETTLALLEGELQRNCGDILAACRAVGVSLIFVAQWRKDDIETHNRLVEAERVGTQGLVSAAIERAVKGVDEDVYYKGEVVGQKTNYSDGLLQTLLKAKVPEFAKDADGSPGGTHVTVNIMPRASSYDEWLEMKQRTMDQPALPAPVEAEFTEINTPAFQGIEL